MAEIIDIANALFSKRREWVNISTEDKSKFAFIFNRLLSKKYPEKSYSLNRKSQDDSVILDMWFNFMKTEPYPDWLWSKSPKISKTDLDDKDFALLMKKLGINKEDDMVYLIDKYPDIVEEELKYYKTKEKNGKK